MTLTYCLSVDILTVISKSYILQETIVGIKGVFVNVLTQCYNQLTTLIILIETGDRLISVRRLSTRNGKARPGNERNSKMILFSDMLQNFESIEFHRLSLVYMVHLRNID